VKVCTLDSEERAKLVCSVFLDMAITVGFQNVTGSSRWEAVGSTTTEDPMLPGTLVVRANL